MKIGLCVKCREKERVIYNKKNQWCYRCYQKDRKERIKSGEHVISAHKDPAITWYSEVEFVKNFFDHKEWLFHPTIFKFNGMRYEPDFYDVKRNMFIEVVGTRQAFYVNLGKYRKFTETFPLISFEVREMTGELIDINAEKFHIQNNEKNSEKELEISEAL